MIYVDNRQEKINADEKLVDLLKNVIEFTLKEEEVDVDCEVSLLFVDNDEIREINNETRGIDRATDVLSFPMLDYEDKKVFKEMYKNYEFSQSDFEREASYLVVHSILHLLGYDHMEDEDKLVMRKREEEILNKLNITRED